MSHFLTSIISIKLAFTVLKMHFEKAKPNIATYRDYKNFSNKRFSLDFFSEIEKYHDCSFNDFHSAFTSILDKHASLKKDI